MPPNGPDASDAVAVLYDELRSLARSRLQRGLAGGSLQATALVHEVWIKLAEGATVQFRDREHFHALAAQAMRWILVDHARRRTAKKRHAATDHSVSMVPDPEDDARLDRILGLDEALERLQVHHPRKARVVHLRHFAGLSVEDTARAIDSSPATVKREWAFARAWLLRELGEREPSSGEFEDR